MTEDNKLKDFKAGLPARAFYRISSIRQTDYKVDRNIVLFILLDLRRPDM